MGVRTETGAQMWPGPHVFSRTGKSTIVAGLRPHVWQVQKVPWAFSGHHYFSQGRYSSECVSHAPLRLGVWVSFTVGFLFGGGEP